MIAVSIKVIGVAAVLFDALELRGIFSVHTIAAVHIVEVPGTAAGLLLGQRVDRNFVGVDDEDAVIKAVSAFGHGVVLAGIGILTSNVYGLASQLVERILGIHGTVDTVVPDERNNSLGNVSIEDVLSVVFHSSLITGPSVAGSRSGAPPVNAGALGVIIVPGRSQIIFSAAHTGLAVGHLEVISVGVNSLAELSFICSDRFSGGLGLDNDIGIVTGPDRVSRSGYYY